MLDGLNKYGLPTKYAIICFIGGIIGVFLANMLGLSQGGATYLSTAIACGIGGAVGGWIRQRKGKDSQPGHCNKPYGRSGFQPRFAPGAISSLRLALRQVWRTFQSGNLSAMGIVILNNDL